MNICVQTSPGRRGEAKPRVFYVGARRLIVATILDSWSDHPYLYFEVSCDDARRFWLRYDTARQAWELAGVFAPRTPAPRSSKALVAVAPQGAAPKRWWSGLLGA